MAARPNPRRSAPITSTNSATPTRSAVCAVGVNEIRREASADDEIAPASELVEVDRPPRDAFIPDGYLFQAVAACCGEGGRLLYALAVRELFARYGEHVNQIPQERRQDFLYELMTITGRALPTFEPMPSQVLPDGVLTADWTQIEPFLRRLAAVAADRRGKFVVSGIYSATSTIRNHHVVNDTGMMDRLRSVTSEITGTPGANCYVAIGFMREDLPAGLKGREQDTVGTLAAVLDFDGKHSPATRHERLPLPPHIEVETSPGNFQSWFIFDRPYSAAEVKPVLTALTRYSLGDHTQSAEHLFRVPGTLNWPNAKKIAAGRSPIPFQAHIVAADYTRPGVTLDALRTAILEKWPDAFDRIKTGSSNACDLDWDTPLPDTVFIEKPADQIIEKLSRAGHDVDRSALAFALIVELGCIGYTPNQALALLHQHATLAVLRHYNEKGDDLDKAFRRDIVKAFTTPNPNRQRMPEAFRDVAREDGEKENVDAGAGLSPGLAGQNEALVLSHGTPLVSAREFVRRRHTDSAGRCTLIRYRSDFFHWTGTHYRPLSDDEMLGQLYKFLDSAVVRTKSEDGEWSVKPFAPDQTKVNRVAHALRGCDIVVSDSLDAPVWLKITLLSLFGEAPEFVACRNGLLHPLLGEIWPHEPGFMTFNALDFDYDPQAPSPTEWLTFLASLWSEDREAIDTLQEWFGYLVGGQTYLQKMLLMIGPKRSGKGTILHTIGALLGAENVSYSKLENLRNDFGLEPLIGKTAMLVGDSRMDTFGAGQGSIVENLLSITGEDGRSVNRKFKRAWEGRLGVRIVIASNEAPRFNDASGTIAHRIIPLRMRISFAEREDHQLKDRIMRELPGIFNWALAGLRRLTERGHFTIPQSARSTVEDIEASASPVSSFVDERCVVAPDRRVDCQQLYADWTRWCGQNGHLAGSQAEFGRKLNAAVPSAERKRATRAGRPWEYIGIGLRDVTVGRSVLALS